MGGRVLVCGYVFVKGVRVGRFRGMRYLAATVVVVLLALLAADRLVGGGRSTASAAAPAQQIGMKVLLITDNNTDPSNASDVAYGDWVNTLKREGVPYDTWVTSSPMPNLSSTGASGTQVANYEGVVVATSGMEGMTSAQWTALQSFEHQFSVRQVTAYASPSSDQGLDVASSTAFLGSTTPISLTGDGSQVFPYLKAVALDTGSFGYEATAAPGANVDPLITGPNSSVALGIYTAADGRQTMFQTFNENPYMLQSQLLRHGELDWLVRNTYF
ncbi:MAG: hypothetical protein JOY58_04860, partial [Solirubrobacterales bacterium]|nr:hypothetical protein [Solirubrobacterales bacterium]